MRTLYIECNMGAAGDMLMAALSELLPDPEDFIRRMNALGLPGVRFERRRAEKCGVTGAHIAVTVDGEEEHSHDVGSREEGVGSREEGKGKREKGRGRREEGEGTSSDRETVQRTVSSEMGAEKEWQEEHAHVHPDLHAPLSTLHSHSHPHGHDHSEAHAHAHDHPDLHSPLSTLHSHHHHHHTSLKDVEAIIAALSLPESVKADAAAVYGLIAEAESRVHGHPVDRVHFHEVGALDAVADVVGVCALMHEIAPERVLVSPIHVGSGQVRCAHGVLPVPAPATALLLEGAPVYGGAIRGELCTPTGAALLRRFADGFGDMPAMKLEKVGYGMGTKDFPWANCVRVMLGETEEVSQSVAELSCNLDDMTGEEIGFAAERLRDAGALDVWTQPIQMKKNRPGTLLACLCPPEREGDFAALMLRHTTTLGVRCRTLRRYTLRREAITLETPYGPVRGKRSRGYGVDRVKPEFDDLAEIASREGISVKEITI